MSEFIVGQLVRVLPRKYTARYGGCFNQGQEVVVAGIEYDAELDEFDVNLRELHGRLEQVYCEDEIELIQTTLPVKASREAIQKEDTVTTAIPKTDIKTLYTVVKNGETHYYGYDREKARQEKADLGGLAAGAEIIQFKPVKTVR